jgi:hypothetical protein
MGVISVPNPYLALQMCTLYHPNLTFIQLSSKLSMKACIPTISIPTLDIS